MLSHACVIKYSNCHIGSKHYSIEQIFQLESNAKIIVAGDVNQLKIKDIMCQHNMEQSLVGM